MDAEELAGLWEYAGKLEVLFAVLYLLASAAGLVCYVLSGIRKIEMYHSWSTRSGKPSERRRKEHEKKRHS